MKLIVGLGNLGPQYNGTKHNMGFDVADELARRWHLSDWRESREAQYVEYRAPEKVYLIKPTTYMNNSGRAVGAWAHFFNIPLEDIAVVQDDMDMAIGQTRIRKGGSHGGHNGIRSTIAALGSEDFLRFKIGIGHPDHTQEAVIGHVLRPFAAADRKVIDQSIQDMASAMELWLQGDLQSAMQKYNKKPPKKEQLATIACFGDSLVQGFPFGPDSSWLAMVEKLTGMHLLNYGQCGECCDEILYRLRETQLPGAVQFVLFMGGMNDLLQSRSVAMILEDMQQAAAFCMAKHHKFCLVLPWLCADAALNVKVQELRTQMRATFKHMTLLDLERAFAKRGVGTDVTSTEANRTVGTDVTGATTNVTGVPTAADRTQFFLDGVHPTATTYDLLGKYAAPILKKWARR
jgi:PTH1 family peptidyl-tRNA hydrolase